MALITRNDVKDAVYGNLTVYCFCSSKLVYDKSTIDRRFLCPCCGKVYDLHESQIIDARDNCLPSEQNVIASRVASEWLKTSGYKKLSYTPDLFLFRNKDGGEVFYGMSRDLIKEWSSSPSRMYIGRSWDQISDKITKLGPTGYALSAVLAGKKVDFDKLMKSNKVFTHGNDHIVTMD
jgi:hypothetical protein